MFEKFYKMISGSDAEIVWVSQDFIDEHKIAPWTEFTVWIPESEGGGLSRVSNERAKVAGLKFRSTEQVVRETLAWAQTRPAEHEMKAGLKPEREAELLKLLLGEKNEK